MPDEPKDAPADDTPDEPSQPKTLDEALDQVEGEEETPAPAKPDEPDEPDEEEEKEEPETPETPEEPEVPAEEPEVPEPVVTEPDTDITKPGVDKVAMKTIDGKTIYITSLDQIPDDADAATPKEWIKVSQELGKLEAKQQVEAAQARAEFIKSQETKQIKEVQKGWSDEIKSLTDSKRLGDPPAKKDRDNPDHAYNQRVEQVFQILQDSVKPGSKYIIQSFEQALDLLEAKEVKDKTAADEKARNEEKSRRGGLIQSGSSGATGTKSTAIPHGVSLDDVLENELQNS